MDTLTQLALRSLCEKSKRLKKQKTSKMHRALYSPQEYQKASEQTYPHELTQLSLFLDNNFFQKLM